MKLLPYKFQKLLQQRDYILPTLKLVWEAAPNAMLGWALLLLIQGLLPGATVYLSKVLVDSLVAATAGGLTDAAIRSVAIPVGLMAGVLVVSEFIKAGLTILRTVQSEYVQDHIRRLVHRKSIEADLAFHEQPDFHDKLHQARDNAASRPLTLLESSGSLIQSLITLITIAVIIVPYGIALPMALIVGALPAFYFLLKFNRQYHKWWERMTPLRRQAEYHDFLITQSYTAAELRLFNLGDYLQGLYHGFRRTLRKENIRLVKRQSFAQLLGGMVSLLVAAAVLAWMLMQTLEGKFTLGDLALFYQAFNRGQALARAGLTQIGQIYGNTLFLGNLFAFLSLEPTVKDPPQPLPIPTNPKSEIRLRDVSFRYPGTERWIFKNFNLTLPANQIVAIVGENGAGKSTLIKLLCRFYDPDSGAIELDGVDIRSYSLQEWRQLLTVMFQFPVTYQKTLEENIAIGDVYAAQDGDRIQRSLEAAGATEIVAKLPDGPQTQLGKWFSGGVELSGGEWQRVSLARAFLRQAPVVILDEPTSFMDSWAEHDWLDRFRQMAEGRTAIVITHRFTLAKRADVVFVMQGGEVVESGTHESLLEQGGLYEQSWRAQTQEQGTVPLPGAPTAGAMA